MTLLTYAGKDLSDYGVVASGEDEFVFPERDVTTYEIPGRDGDLIVDHGRFKNVSIPYNCGIASKFRDNIDELRNFLCRQIGYNKLVSSNHDGYRLARFAGISNFDIGQKAESGKFTLTFDCKPYSAKKVNSITPSWTRNTSYYTCTSTVTSLVSGSEILSGLLITIGNTNKSITKLQVYVNMSTSSDYPYYYAAFTFGTPYPTELSLDLIDNETSFDDYTFNGEYVSTSTSSTISDFATFCANIKEIEFDSDKSVKIVVTYGSVPPTIGSMDASVDVYAQRL